MFPYSLSLVDVIALAHQDVNARHSTRDSLAAITIMTWCSTEY